MLGIKAMIWDEELGAPRGVEAETVWTSPVLQAECKAQLLFGGPPRDHAAPDEDCNCGIHACSSKHWLWEYLSHPNIHDYGADSYRVFTALVEASGKVVEHQFGWRAEVGTILAVTSGLTLLGFYKELHMDLRAATYLGVPCLEFHELEHWLHGYPPKRLTSSIGGPHESAETAAAASALSRGQWPGMAFVLAGGTKQTVIPPN
jgi:hypothetical protein